ncbi:GSCOCG00009660001-RA-CDS, partial [Cotesia congregata]
MRVTRYFAVKVIIVILYLLTVCHSYPSSVGIENDKNEEMKKSFKQKTKNIIFNNVNTTPHQNIKINLKRFDRSVDSESPELGAMDPLTHDDLNLSEILVTSSPAETTQQNNSCCGQKINLYFKTTVSIIKQWLDSLVDDCNKVNEILTFETTNKSDIENIRYCCTELKGNYFKLFKSVISALKKLQIDNHSAINNTCPILAGLEKIKNNIITFTQRPNKIMMMNNPFDNLLKRFSGMSVSTNEIPQNTSNNSNSMINHENTGLKKVIENLRNVPQKIKVSIKELINNIRKNLTPGSCQKLQGSTDGNTSDHVDNRSHSSIHQKLPFLNPFENVLKLRIILNFPFNNPISQAFNNLRDLPQQIKEIIDEQISNIRDIFTKNDCREVAEMTNNDSGGNNSSDSSNTHEKVSSQEPSNGLVKNWFNSSMIGRSIDNNPFSQAFNNLRNIPQKIRKSIDDVISNIRNILTSGKYKESKAMLIRSDSNPVTNSSVLDDISSRNPFVDKLNFPSLLKSPFNNPFSQVFDNLRNLLQQIGKTIDEQISIIRNLFTKNNCKKLTSMTNNDSRVNNSSDSSTHEKLSTQEPLNGLVKNWFGFPIIEKSTVNNRFSQAFDNLRNIPQKIRKSIDDAVNNIRNILTSGKYKESKAMPNRNDSDLSTNSSVLDNILSRNPFADKLNFPSFFKSPFNNPISQVFNNLRDLPQQIKKIIDEQISNIRDIFTKNDCREVAEMTNNDSGGNNSSDS